MSTSGHLKFQGTNRATFVGTTSNIMFDTTSTSLGIGVTGTDHPSSNLYVTGNAYVSSNIAVGGVLTMGTVNVVARHDLEAVTATGNITPLTVEFTNPTTSLVASGNVVVTGNVVAGYLYGDGSNISGISSNLDQIVNNGNVTSNTVQFSNATTGFVTTANVEVGGELTVSGNVVVDTNTLFVDSVNNRVGIGTTSPQRLLHLKRSGAATFKRIQNANNNNGCGIELMRGDSDTWGATSWSDWRISNTEHLDFGVKFTGTDITSVLHLNVNGNVGAGTTEPLTKLQVQHTGGSDTISTTTALVSIIENQVPNYGKYGLFMGVSQSTGKPWLQGLRYAGTALQNNDKFHIQLNPLGGIIIVNGTTYSSDDRIK